VTLASPNDKLIVLSAQANGTDRQVANAWNKYGGFLAPLSSQLNVDPGAALAVLAIESSGRGIGADGRMIIRFENHLFFNRWGMTPRRLQPILRLQPRPALARSSVSPRPRPALSAVPRPPGWRVEGV
jgi:N-acetylmuramidase